MGVDASERGTGKRATAARATANRLTFPQQTLDDDPGALFGVEGQSAIPDALAQGIAWQMQLDRARLQGPVEDLYPLAMKLMSTWRFLRDEQDHSRRDPRDGALLVTDLRAFSDASITVEVIETSNAAGIPVTKTWKEPALPPWAPSKFPEGTPARLIARYPKRPVDIGVIPPFEPPNVRQWRAILDAGPQQSSGRAKPDPRDRPIPIKEPPPELPRNQAQLQAALDKTMKKVAHDLVDVKIASLGVGPSPGVTDAIRILSALSENDLGRATDTTFKSPWADTPLIEMTEVFLYHSVYSVVLDKFGEPFDLLGRFDYAILVPSSGEQVQRNVPPPGVYVSVQHYGNGDFRCSPRPIKKLLEGGVGSFTVSGYGDTHAHEFQTRIQQYMDSYQPGYLAVLSVRSAFDRDELSVDTIKSKIPPLAEQALACAARELRKRLKNDLENYEQFLASLGEDIIRKLIVDKIRDEVVAFLEKKLGAEILPLVNVAFMTYDLVTGDADRSQVLHALGAMILAIRGKVADDMTIASKILGKIICDRVYQKIRQALIDRGAKLAQHVGSKARPSSHDEPAPPPEPAADAQPAQPEAIGGAATAPPADTAASAGTSKTDDHALAPLSQADVEHAERMRNAQHEQDQQRAARNTDDTATHDKATDATSTREGDAALHVVGTPIRGEDELPAHTTVDDRATGSSATADAATGDDGTHEPADTGRRARVYRGKPVQPHATGDPMEFQTPIGAPADHTIAGVAVTSRSPDVLIGARKDHFRNDVANVINADSDHPMRAMLDPNTVGTDHPKFIEQAYGKGGTRDEEWRRHPEDWQAGHMRTGHAGDADVLVMQSRYRNQLQDNTQETGGGEVTHDYAVVIGHIAVEGSTAWDLWEAGYIDLSYDQMKSLPKLPL